jgi:hypothetical protein
MTEENDGIPAQDIVRWAVMVLILLACLGAYFAFAPSVRPPLAPPGIAP